jgi:hypothetical protein
MNRRFLAFLAAASFVSSFVNAEDSESQTQLPEAPAQVQNEQTNTPQPVVKQTLKTEPFTAFTGKILKNKVRLRLNPSLDSPIIQELSRGDLFEVTGETDDFFAVLPSPDKKAYIFRTFVLDNTVEGTRVNVRLEPSTDAPVLAQLNSGDHVEGSISPTNNKWLEITMPESVRFFVAKEYVEKAGDANLVKTLAAKRIEVNQLLNSTYQIGQLELQKPFEEIRLDGIIANYDKIISDYPEFPEQGARARELLKMTEDNYLQKKIAYLEAKAQNNVQPFTPPQEPLNPSDSFASEPTQPTHTHTTEVTAKMTAWSSTEQNLFNEWALTHNEMNMDAFYAEQRDQAKSMTGIVEPYTKAVKNKPGDFLLVNPATHLPIGFLYSTTVNLQDRVGQQVTILASPRDNHHFAYPAFFVLGVE